MTICDRCGFSGALKDRFVRVGNSPPYGSASVSFNGELCDICYNLAIERISRALVDMKMEINMREKK